jgi:hypothetical protein
MQESDYQLELANGMSFFGLEYATDEKGEPVLDENGEPKTQLIEDWENPLLDTDEVRMAGYEGWKADADAKREENIQEQAVSSLERNMIATAESTDWDDAIVEISDPASLQALLQSGLGLEESKKVLNNMKTFASSQKEIQDKKFEVSQTNTTRDYITQIADSRVPVDEGDPNAPVMPTITELTDAFRSGDINETQYNGLVKRIGNVDIVTDRATQSALYTKSLDIWRGSTSKADFDEELNKQSGNLDDNAYASLSKSAADTLKSSQAESLSRANTEAGRLIVDHTEEDAFQKFIADSIAGLNPDAANLFKDEANEIRQLQFWSLSRYNAELRQWVTDNPDKIGKDFYQYSESLKHEYWNKSRQDIEVEKAKTQVKLRQIDASGNEPSRKSFGLNTNTKEARRKRYEELKAKAGR